MLFLITSITSLRFLLEILDKLPQLLVSKLLNLFFKRPKLLNQLKPALKTLVLTLSDIIFNYLENES
ncbi:hypothetical protein DRO64_08990 [Candidatus Bathyarchaeota archaeon]|nr:MAG: hypothetical protein DRO64_08990 [Candidatus Bathyarchaeota archaeon]